ncbi:MAG: putative DNA-binding domain-containing protein [Pseudobacteriovorax sp.]|nr:putative DNA-binding domain-containing protein [Pseudobacteriovorax sp.]
MTTSLDRFCEAVRNAQYEAPDGMNPEALEVYRRHYQFTHLDVLEQVFLVVRKALGAENFRALSWEYISSKGGSQSHSLVALAEEFPTYLSACAILEAADVCCELAKIDWLRYHADPNKIVASFAGVLELWQSIALDLDGQNPPIDFGQAKMIRAYWEDEDLCLRASDS